MVLKFGAFRLIPSLALILLWADGTLASGLTLTWVRSEGALAYVIEREATAGSFVEIARAAAGVTSYLDPTASSGVTYCYRVRAWSATALSDYSNVACGAPPATGGLFVDDFNRPDSSSWLGNGWTTVSGLLMLQARQVRNATVKTIHTAVQAGLVGATQVVSARFASVDNNLGPRFGLLVRYRDPRNYYACYRTTGGSSLLRISKMLNGVETILKYAALPNPIREQFFTLGCQAAGTTLILSLNGATKLSAVDATFVSGTVGMFMGYAQAGTTGAASHRADDFAAGVD